MRFVLGSRFIVLPSVARRTYSTQACTYCSQFCGALSYALRDSLYVPPVVFLQRAAPVLLKGAAEPFLSFCLAPQDAI